MNEPHGGKLISRFVDGAREDQLRSMMADFVEIELSQTQLQDAINIGCGRYSPIEGFLTRSDFLHVVNDMTLEDGTVWSLPIVLDVDTETAELIEPGKIVPLRAPRGECIGVMEVDEIFKFNRAETAKKVLSTSDKSHPGVAEYTNLKDFLFGGPLWLFETIREDPYDLHPAETRVLFKERGWETVVGFQTRNAPHRGHEYLQKSALELVDGLLIQPKIGDKKIGDYQDEAILSSYNKLLEHYYPHNSSALSVFPSKMRYAGPREAVFDALVRKNQGCTHFVVGRDHAGVKDFYDGYDAHRIFERIADIDIEPLFYSTSFFCSKCDGMASEKVCPHQDDARHYPSGSRIRDLIRKGESPSPKVMRPEVATHILGLDEPFVNA